MQLTGDDLAATEAPILLAGGPVTFNADLGELLRAGLIRGHTDNRYPLPGSCRLARDADRDNELLDTWIDHYRVAGL